jgi:hypothetical protein
MTNKDSPVRKLVQMFLAFSVLALRTDGQNLPEKKSSDIQFQWAATNFVACGGWGRMIRLTNTDWLCVNTRFAQSQSTLQIHSCTYLPGSWNLVSEVEEPGRFMDNGELIQLPGGEILLTGRSLIEGQSYRLPVYRSLDDGKSWTVFGNIDSNEGSPGTLKQRGLWEPHFFRLNDGRLAVA